MQTLTVAALKRLSHRGFQPAHELAAALSMDAAALNAALQTALVDGWPLQYEAGRGYRLAHALDWLDAGRIGPAIAPTGLTLRVVDCCASTNAELLREARAGIADRRVLAAELQTAGRGRQGRPWRSGVCTSLTFSLAWRFAMPVAALSGLSLAVGVAAVRALQRHGVNAGLKWPNDLLWQGRKLGGVLIELHDTPGRGCTAVIGVGLNVRLDAAERARIDQPVADLHEAGCGAPRSEVLAALLDELARVLRSFEAAGFAALRDEWCRYHAHANRPVELLLPGGERLRGIAAGVDAAGRLLLATATGTQPIMTGEVSLRASA